MKSETDQKNKMLMLAIAVLVGVVIFLLGIMAGYFFLKMNQSQVPTMNGEVINLSDPPELTKEMEAELTKVVEMDLKANADLIKDAKDARTAPLATSILRANWRDSVKEVSALDIFDEEVTDWITEESSFYEIGTVTGDRYKGGTIYLASIPCEGPCFYPLYYRFIDTPESGLHYLAEHSQELSDYDSLDQAKFSVDTESFFAELLFPMTIEVGALPIKLHRDSGVTQLFEPTNVTSAISTSEVGELFTTKTRDDEFNTIYDKFGYYAKAPDGTLLVYQLLPDFIGDDGVPAITFDNGVKNTNGYSYSDQGGCGSINYASIVTALYNSNELVKVGSAFDTSIYTFKDTRHEFLVDYYENKYTYFGDGEKLSYEEFLNSYPVLFYYDAFDRLTKLESRQFVPAAECGKPVIYLYPEETTEVHVEVAPVGGFTYTDPVYDGGWDVIAQPNGQLTEIKSGLEYPYLFWEGDGGIYTEPDKGWVVEKAEVESFLVDSLTKLGLNEQEIFDFNEFWLPRMESDPYYFISFYGTGVMDQLAPLNVTPQPDTIIRVLMDYHGLQEPIDVEPYPLRALPREGFTLIEWGGVIR